MKIEAIDNSLASLVSNAVKTKRAIKDKPLEEKFWHINMPCLSNNRKFLFTKLRLNSLIPFSFQNLLLYVLRNNQCFVLFLFYVFRVLSSNNIKNLTVDLFASLKDLQIL